MHHTVTLLPTVFEHFGYLVPQVMKTTFGLVIISYGIAIATAQSSYSDICSGPRNRNPRANVDGNYKVTYYCDSQLSLPDTFHLSGFGVINAEDCARICRDASNNDCRGAVWSHKDAECWISNSQEGGRLIYASDLLYIDPNDHTADLAQCQKEKTQLQAELEKCKTSGGGDGGSGMKCPYNDLSNVKDDDGGKTFKVYCKRLDDFGAANIRVFPATNAQACIQACAYTDGCTRAIWETKATLKDPTNCWLRGWQGVNKVPTTASDAYSSAHLQ
ncbi:uncharacterized protein N7458_008778 [Penicillium daleae]|uniref:Apple domain-containing protein n=1 Tax=Penicillium daleae TaxID=63821 RepID=A0AAD6BWC8_9EURO|nr:uncharacterized protein N7458_008778 [Penicillium daleae]KAJ5437780.1 hypothetical protein N7458_008778 [Penicillium daleae]